MLDHQECIKIRTTLEKCTNEQLREKVRSYPWARSRISEWEKKARELKLPPQFAGGGEEQLINERSGELIRKMLTNEITAAERREFVELRHIWVVLKIPEFVRAHAA